ncbi:MAG: UvrD-helicase domain-containing protein [Treponema sp.]|jgi:DNA helicase-2/ATP-dependent DNA helicase PcrA|nr:UvrD-helicase domain-containing protein [Treponema sp.]
MPKLNYEGELNGPQLKAALSLEGPLLIIAGAGSGKTRVITFRIARMLEKGIGQHAILALTFTNKAAREMESRVKELTGRKLRDLTVSTFHAFGVKILREEIEALGYRKNFSIYDETDRNRLIKECLRECRVGSEGVDLYKLGQLFSNVKIGRFRWGSDPGGDTADSVWEPVYREYQLGLKIYNALDFDDLLSLPIRLFEEHPEILEKYHHRYRYLMVDEFQDTSLIQYRLLRMLAWGNAAGQGNGGQGEGGRGPNVCVVGDDDQSIYSWRGANYENLSRFEKDFPGTLEIKLEQNYRSTTTILEAANGVIANNSSRKDKRLWSGNGGGRPIELCSPETESEEADFIAGEIKRLRYQDKLRYDDFGVLLRTNSQFPVIEEAFLAENIPYRVSGGMSFFEREEIRDIISYLRVIGNPDDDVNLLRIINTPRRGIGKSTIASLSEQAKKNHTSLWQTLQRFEGRHSALQEAERSQGKLFQHETGADSFHGAFHRPSQGDQPPRGEIEGFVTLIEGWRESILGKKGFSQMVRAMVDSVDYWSYLVSEYSKNEKIARWKFGNIDYLIKSIETWEQDGDNLDPSLYPWLNRISLISRSDGDDSEDGQFRSGRVNLMTIHAAKGLEFPVVFIAGAEAGIIPHKRSIEDGEAGSPSPPDTAGPAAASPPALEEERRLFYVAITRARDKLYISSCRKRRTRQELCDSAPSPFLEEIPPHLITQHAEQTEEESGTEDFFSRIKERLR